MKNKIKNIVIALLTIYCVYLHWQIAGIKQILQVLIDYNLNRL